MKCMFSFLSAYKYYKAALIDGYLSAIYVRRRTQLVSVHVLKNARHSEAQKDCLTYTTTQRQTCLKCPSATFTRVLCCFCKTLKAFTVPCISMQVVSKSLLKFSAQESRDSPRGKGVPFKNSKHFEYSSKIRLLKF